VKASLLAVVAAALAASSPGLGGTGSVTLRARSTVIRSDERPVLLGEISSGQAGEYVAVQGKECGVPGAFFRGIAGATTTDGGGWTTDQIIQRTTTAYRAVWKHSVSAPLTVRQRINVWLIRTGKRFQVGVSGEVGNWDRKRVTIQRLTTVGWRRLTSVVVRSQGVITVARRGGLRFSVPKGTLLRAVLSLAQARPCYLAGYSQLIHA
jgi:hypothetical protein